MLNKLIYIIVFCSFRKSFVYVFIFYLFIFLYIYYSILVQRWRVSNATYSYNKADIKQSNGILPDFQLADCQDNGRESDSGDGFLGT